VETFMDLCHKCFTHHTFFEFSPKIEDVSVVLRKLFIKQTFLSSLNLFVRSFLKNSWLGCLCDDKACSACGPKKTFLSVEIDHPHVVTDALTKDRRKFKSP